MLKLQSMRVNVGSKSLVNIILFLLYAESCCCVTINRESRDVSDLLGIHNCNFITGSFLESGRCRCGGPPNIVTTKTGGIGCVADEDIEKGKGTWMLIY